jgi:hypothetical protein
MDAIQGYPDSPLFFPSLGHGHVPNAYKSLNSKFPICSNGVS